MSALFRSIRIFVSVTLLLALIGGAAAGFWYWSYLITPSPGQGEVVVLIPKGTGVRAIGALLAEHGVLRNDVRFLALVSLSGISAKLQAGEYSIPLGLTPPEVLKLLKDGAFIRYFVTIPEGLTAEQIATLFAQDGWVQQEHFLELVHDADFIHQLGLNTSSLEGYLFPETYTLVHHETDTRAVIQMMVREFNKTWQQFDQTTLEQGMDQHQVLTLASLVEKEAALAQERPLVARVFLNRLDRKMRLQSDPTVSYGVPNFTPPLTKADLKRPTPYNTYVIPGLPPGPICNPGKAAMSAVLHPAQAEFLYFVAKNDGSHVFSKTLQEHNRAVQNYQRNR